MRFGCRGDHIEHFCRRSGSFFGTGCAVVPASTMVCEPTSLVDDYESSGGAEAAAAVLGCFFNPVSRRSW